MLAIRTSKKGERHLSQSIRKVGRPFTRRPALGNDWVTRKCSILAVRLGFIDYESYWSGVMYPPKPVGGRRIDADIESHPYFGPQQLSYTALSSKKVTYFRSTVWSSLVQVGSCNPLSLVTSARRSVTAIQSILISVSAALSLLICVRSQ